MYLRQPHFRHPSNFKSGISLTKDINDEDYKQNSQIARKKFNVNFSLVLLNKVPTGLEIIGLNVNTPNKMHDILLINETVPIRKFISYFVKENEPIIQLLKETKINMGTLIGERFKEVDIPVMINLRERELFYKKIGIHANASLTVKELTVLKNILKGYSANQIAGELKLSCRTIEHCIERIKCKLVCFSKSELIQKARDLELLGYFDNY